MAADSLYDAILGGYTCRQVTRGRFGYNAKPVEGCFSGMLDVDTYFGGPADPRAQFSSQDVAAALVAISATAGLAVAAGTIAVPFQKRSNQSTFAGGSTNFKATGANGLIVPQSAEASQDGDATIELEAIFRSTDGTNPVTISTGNALASQAFNALHTLGPVAVNTQVIEEVISAKINFGLTIEVKRFNGLNFPQRIYIVKRRPSIDLTFTDLDELTGFAAAFTVMTSASVYFRKRSGATFVADGTAQHCKFSFADGIAGTEHVEGSNEQDGTATLRLYGETLTASGASAIS